MKLSRTGRMDNIFSNELAKKAAELEPIDKRLEKDHKTQDGTLELIIDQDRKPAPKVEMEKQLRDHDKSNSGNSKLTGTTEERLNKADKGAYPHRNEKAWERTEDKRPVNALEGEMGKSSDEKKKERWDKAQKKAQLENLEENLEGVANGVSGDQVDIKDDVTRNKKLVNNVDEMGEDIEELKRQKIQQDQEAAQQQSNGVVAYNKSKRVLAEQKKKVEAAFGEYFKHKTISNPWGRNLKEAKQLDATMSGIMSKASTENRVLSDDERSQIDALKLRKTEILKVIWDRK